MNERGVSLTEGPATPAAPSLDGTLSSVGKRFDDILARLSAETGEAQKESSAYKKILEGVGADLINKTNEVLVEQLLLLRKETQRHAERLARLEAELAHSDDELTSLRHALRQARHEAETDALTGIANRRSFDGQLAEMMQEAAVTREPLSLILLDIDHFKRFNDTHGHKAGDLVLRLVASRLSDMVKGRDLVARYGGEEFIILLPQTHLEGGRILAEKIRAGVAANQIIIKRTGRSLGTVTLSIGVAQYDGSESAEGFVERADAQLYLAKSSGRNRVMPK
ncbi:MAG: GGDEF domain-containing protein [Geminicoccaceae bacterium]|nr:GGDEF domain-containing protein [Geminicoccaceae bacterium]